eukprot:scaffold15810_cov117-Isochrysis_galbana.AAC.5
MRREEAASRRLRSLPLCPESPSSERGVRLHSVGGECRTMQNYVCIFEFAPGTFESTSSSTFHQRPMCRFGVARWIPAHGRASRAQ